VNRVLPSMSIAGQRWLVGAERTIADIAVGSQLAEIVRTSHLAPEIARRQRVTEWLTRM
jgi:glutathione S-transferase